MERSRRSKRPSDSSEHETTNSLHDRKNKKRRSKQQQQPADDNNDNQDHPQPKLVGQPQPDLDKENSQNGVAFVADDYDEEEAIIIANTNAAELEPKVVSGEDEDADPDDFVADADAAADDEDEEFVGDAEVNENENDEEAEADAQEATNNTNSNNNMDDAEEEVADASLPRQLQKKKRAFGESAEVGVITKIYCQDFMCHRKLTVDLNRNINFIHGQNGSGKSAILAAIQICLGASARRTHRAGSLKDMIRKDGSGTIPSCAIVRVTLLNNGSDAYQPEEYGDTITIERRIALSGGYNGYRLLDSTGKEKSRSKKDLDTMLDTLNIQVDNPVAVLDQEEAKKFLMGKDEDKYAFFMKATELENIDRKVCTMKHERDDIELTIDRKKDGLEHKAQQVHELSQKLAEFRMLAKLKHKQCKQALELRWAVYTAADSEYNDAVTKWNVVKAKLEQKQKELNTIHENAEMMDPNDVLQNKRERIESLLAEAQEQSETKKKLEQELKDAYQPYKDADRKLQALRRHIDSAQKQHKAAKLRLKEKRDEIIERESSAESEAARRTIQVQKAEERKTQVEAQIDTLKEEQAKWYHAYEEAEGPVSHARREVEEISRRLHGIRGKIQSLQNSSGNSLAVYGRNVPRVAELVEQARRQGKFRGPVFGPIGASLKIVPGKEDFAEIAETALGGVLDKFIVTNDVDSKLMRQIRESARCQQDCGVFKVAIAARYNIPNPPNVEGIETVASVLTIEDDIVFNCLVDNSKIDKKALGREKGQTERALLTESNGVLSIRGRIQEVYFLPKGDKWTVNSGAIALFSNSHKMRRTIGVDTSAAIAEAERDEQKMSEDLAEAKRLEGKLEHDHSTAMKSWNVAKRNCSHSLQEVEDLTEQIERMRAEIENASSETTFDTSEYEEEVAQTGEKLNELTKSAQDLQVQLEELESPIRDIKAKLDDAAEKDLTQILATQSQYKDKVAKLEMKLQKYRDAVDEQSSFVDTKEKQRNEVLAKARQAHFMYERDKAKEASEEGGVISEDNSPDPDEPPTTEQLEQIEPQEVDRSVEECHNRLKNIKAKIVEEAKRQGIQSGNEEEIRIKYLNARMELKQATDEISKLEEKAQQFENDIEDRRMLWKAFRKNLVKKTSLAFGNMLGFTNYSGNLDFDHKEGTLQLQVSKNSAEKSQSNDVKALSGGERSYTTMCLLLALGEHLETPFRILDEFDVFLDSEVRKLTIKSLIHVAKKMKHRQFIFITPQDLSSVTPDKYLKILKLKPPDRYDHVGGPTQQTLEFSQNRSE